METIRQGSKGDTVKQWQEFLNKALPDLVPIKVDGSFGPITFYRTITWQQLNPIKADGIVGPATWEYAMKLAAKLGIVFGAAAVGGVLTAVFSSKNPRDKIVEIAKTQLGAQDPDKYWAVVQPALVNSDKAWCGGFALWALHKAGVAKDIIWQIGKGFTAINGLPTTKNPKPGDIAYLDQPFQHHAIVESFDPITKTVKTIDGNQTGNTVKTKTLTAKDWTAFYSIEPFLNTANV
jgi:Putative peptidoglycan binding domain/CHAP domain